MKKNLKKDIIIEEKQDRNIAFAITLQFCLLITNYTFKQVFNITDPSTRAAVSALFMILVGIAFLANFRVVFKRIGKLFIVTYCIFFILILFNLLLFNENTEYIIEISFYIFLICIPIFLYYFSIRDKSIFLNMLIKSAYYQMVLSIIFFVSVDFSIMKYDMVYSYLVLVPIVILLYKIYNDFILLDFILISFGIISIIILGSRGPLLSLIVYYLVLILNNYFRSKSMIRKMVIPLIVIITLFFLMISYKEILLSINKLLNNFEISSRTIRMLLSENIDFSSGRNTIYKYSIEQIINKPIFGYGLAGDRVLLNGTYPHNIILEIIVQFGIILGGLILIVFSVYWFVAMFKNKNKVEQDLAIMFFGIGLVQLFVSGSYITSSNFWIFMAICINSVHYRKSINNSKVEKSNNIENKLN